MIILPHHTLPTKQRMLKRRNETDIVLNLKIMSENTQEARLLWHSETKNHGLGLHSTEAFPLCSNKAPLALMAESSQEMVRQAQLSPFEL